MERKFEDLHAGVVKHLCKMFIDYKDPLGTRNSCINNPLLDHRIFDIFVHHLWGEPEYEKSVAEFLKAEKADEEAFDDRLRNSVYDILYEARYGLHTKMAAERRLRY